MRHSEGERSRSGVADRMRLTEKDELTPELERLAEFVDQQPSAVREAFQFCMAEATEGKRRSQAGSHSSGGWADVA